MATAEPKVEREVLRQLNLYEVLQVSAKASPEVVHAAYRVLARLYHPDVNDTPHAARMMRQLNAAYRVLSDPERRAKYDSQRAHMWRARSVASAAAARQRSYADAVRDMGPTPTSPTPRQAVHSAYAKPSWRIGRLIALLMLFMAMMGAILVAFWVVAGILDDDPHLMLRSAMSMTHGVL